MMLRESGGPLSPNKILLHMRSINGQIGNGSQEDAHEFLRSALNYILLILMKKKNAHLGTVCFRNDFSGKFEFLRFKYLFLNGCSVCVQVYCCFYAIYKFGGIRWRKCC